MRAAQKEVIQKPKQRLIIKNIKKAMENTNIIPRITLKSMEVVKAYIVTAPVTAPVHIAAM
jgi:hypothetical protein